jgi:hemerythrin-like domain-containing protein
MDPLEVMLEEHVIISEVIKVLDIAAEKLAAGEKIKPEIFEKILDIIKNFADRCHHGKEEDVLFPLISERDAKQAQVIKFFLEDHLKGRNFVRGMREALAKNDADGIVKNAKGYTGLLPTHIKKENAIFPRWIQPLPEETKEELSERFEDIEKKVIGIGKHQEYIREIEKLKNSL